jgi:hypothetical protein
MDKLDGPVACRPEGVGRYHKGAPGNTVRTDSYGFPATLALDDVMRRLCEGGKTRLATGSRLD